MPEALEASTVLVVSLVKTCSNFWSCSWVFDHFHWHCLNFSAAQLVEHLAGVLKDPSLIPSEEESYSLKFLLKRK